MAPCRASAPCSVSLSRLIVVELLVLANKCQSINQSDCKEFTQFTYFLSQKPDKAARKELIFLEQRQKVCYSCIVNLPPSLLLRCQFIDGSQIHTHNTHTDKCGRGAAHYFTRPQAKQWRHATPRYACHMVNLSHMLYAFACVCVCACLLVCIKHARQTARHKVPDG